MGFFVIPSDYNERLHPSVVPIFIADTDSEGNPINQEWIERGVVPVSDLLRRAARRLLGDSWRVSEITERPVHQLSCKYPTSLPDMPSRHVLNRARWYAADLRAGSQRARRKRDVDLLTARLQTFPDQHDPLADLLLRDTWQRLLEALEREGSRDMQEMAIMMIRNRPAKEFERRFGESRNTLSQRFYRTARRVAAAARITW